MSKANTLAANQERAKNYLERFTTGVVPPFIKGERVLSRAGGTSTRSIRPQMPGSARSRLAMR